MHTVSAVLAGCYSARAVTAGAAVGRVRYLQARAPDSGGHCSLKKAGTQLLDPGPEKKMGVSVSMLASTALQLVKLFAFEDFSTCQCAWLCTPLC